jgi:hypothetical protein
MTGLKMAQECAEWRSHARRSQGFARLAAVARALKASLEVVNGRLFLAALLPLKNNATGERRRQRIALGLDDTPRHRRTAQRQQQLLQRALDQGSFCWSDWQADAAAAAVISWGQVERQLRQRLVLTERRISEHSWEQNHGRRFRQLGLSAPASTTAMAEHLAGLDPASAEYSKCLALFKRVERLLGLPAPLAAAPRYRGPSEQGIPSDEQIIDWVLGAGERRWHLAMCATYGLRPHEVEESTLLDDGLLQVHDSAKTGGRIVPPLHPHWQQLLGVAEAMPYRSGLHLSLPERRQRITIWLGRGNRKRDIPWRTYALRHAYAIRIWRASVQTVDVAMAARVMGHSAAIHSNTYRRWIDQRALAQQVLQQFTGAAPGQELQPPG